MILEACDKKIGAKCGVHESKSFQVDFIICHFPSDGVGVRGENPSPFLVTLSSSWQVNNIGYQNPQENKLTFSHEINEIVLNHFPVHYSRYFGRLFGILWETFGTFMDMCLKVHSDRSVIKPVHRHLSDNIYTVNSTDLHFRVSHRDYYSHIWSPGQSDANHIHFESSGLKISTKSNLNFTWSSGWVPVTHSRVMFSCRLILCTTYLRIFYN